MKTLKDKRRNWKPEEVEKLKTYFSMKRTVAEKEALVKELDRKYNTIYVKYLDLNKNKPTVQKNSSEKELVVTNISHPKIPTVTTIKVGDAIMETFASRIKINDVFIEV